MEWRAWFEAIGVSTPVRPRFVPFDSYPLALQAAVAGQGIALGWRRTTELLMEEGKLIRPCAEFASRPTELSVYRNGSQHRRKPTEDLIAWLSDELSQ